jgi:hypothetical protein
MLAKVAAGERSADLMDATTGNSGDHAVPAQQRSRYGTRGARLPKLGIDAVRLISGTP